PAALAFPSLADVFLLLLVLDKMFAFVFNDQHAAIHQLSDKVGIEIALRQWKREQSDDVAHPALYLRAHFKSLRAFKLRCRVEFTNKILTIEMLGKLEPALVEGCRRVVLRENKLV